MKILWQPSIQEWYCVDSGRPVRKGAGDRCLNHAARPTPCYSSTRNPRCEHPKLSRNHPYPYCSECGLEGRVVSLESAVEETRVVTCQFNQEPHTLTDDCTDFVDYVETSDDSV